MVNKHDDGAETQRKITQLYTKDELKKKKKRTVVKLRFVLV